MDGGPVVLLGQGEQYADPEDWRELVRTRRIRRGVELLVRRDGLTSLRRPEDVPELASVLDQVDPPEPPPSTTPDARRAPPAAARSTSVPPSRGAAARPPTAPSGPPQAARLPTAAPRKPRFGGVWLWLVAVGVLLLVRLCAPDGLPWPTFGARADEGAEYAPGVEGRDRTACAQAHGWIARAACDDPRFARLRPALAQAYSARIAGARPDERSTLVEEQKRWAAGRGACRTEAAPGACLARLYRDRTAELRAATPERGLAAALPRQAAGPLRSIDRPDWVRRPGADDFADAYPERALRQGVEGRALLSCRADASGGLTACDIVSEDPPDFGFGGAALRLSRFYQLRPLAPDGRAVEGAKVDVPVTFRPG